MYIEHEAIEYFKSFDFREKFFLKYATGFEGLFSSRRIGSSLEFEQYKEHHPSDSIKDIDWKKYARLRKLLTRQFESFSHLKVLFIIDISNSMNFPERVNSKLEVAKKFVSIFSYLLLKSQNEVYISFVGDLLYNIGKVSLERIEKVFAEISSEGSLNPGNLFKLDILELTFFISDGWWGKDFKTIYEFLISRGINFFHILSKEELKLDYKNVFDIIDCETKKKISLDIDRIRLNYIERLNGRIDFFKKNLGKYGLYYHIIETELPYYYSLKKFMDSL